MSSMVGAYVRQITPSSTNVTSGGVPADVAYERYGELLVSLNDGDGLPGLLAWERKYFNGAMPSFLREQILGANFSQHPVGFLQYMEKIVPPSQLLARPGMG